MIRVLKPNGTILLQVWCNMENKNNKKFINLLDLKINNIYIILSII